MSVTSGNNRKSVVVMLIIYVLFVAFLALGNYLFGRFPENEALGGIVLGLSSIVLGIIVPFHFRRVGAVSFRFLPQAGNARNTILGTVLFTLFYLLIFPAGILLQRTTFAFFANPPSAMAAISTFLSLLWATAAYGFIFWGGLLHTLKDASSPLIAVITTSLLFSVYHLSQFEMALPTPGFLLMTFVSGLILAAFTLRVKCVLPTLIVHQLGHFFYFATLQENPFAEDFDRFVASVVMLLFLYGIYEGVFRLVRKSREKRSELDRSEQVSVNPL
ncbi:MAG: CPBP family intramembrane metalloprotease [Anaerolineae bacterium]|nr:CPBP family intramembrane metalloprotease [Anaerolineae bacterium]